MSTRQLRPSIQNLRGLLSHVVVEDDRYIVGCPSITLDFGATDGNMTEGYLLMKLCAEAERPCDYYVCRDNPSWRAIKDALVLARATYLSQKTPKKSDPTKPPCLEFNYENKRGFTFLVALAILEDRFAVDNTSEQLLRAVRSAMGALSVQLLTKAATD
jgi:hypothetical protein